MHVFLCGPVHIGKSTAIQKAIQQLSLKYPIQLGGFITYPGLTPDLDIYISPAWKSKKYHLENRVAKRNRVSSSPFPQVFDTLGVSILEQSKTHKKNLLCMDELGFFEKEAYQFQKAVLQCLEEETPILGAVKEAPIPWLDSIKEHPNVELISISLENRDRIPAMIVDILEPSLKKGYSK